MVAFSERRAASLFSALAASRGGDPSFHIAVELWGETQGDQGWSGGAVGENHSEDEKVQEDRGDGGNGRSYTGGRRFSALLLNEGSSCWFKMRTIENVAYAGSQR